MRSFLIILSTVYTGVPEEDGASEIVAMLCEFIGTIFRYTSVVTNDGTLKELLSSLYMLSTTDVTKRKMVKKTLHVVHDIYT